MSTQLADRTKCKKSDSIAARKDFEKCFASHIRKHYKDFYNCCRCDDPFDTHYHIGISITDTEVIIFNVQGNHKYVIPHKITRGDISEIITSEGGNFNDGIMYHIKPYNLSTYPALSEEEYSSPSTIKNMLAAISKARKEEFKENLKNEFEKFILSRIPFENRVTVYVTKDYYSVSLIESKLCSSGSPHFKAYLPVKYAIEFLSELYNATCEEKFRLVDEWEPEYYYEIHFSR